MFQRKIKNRISILEKVIYSSLTGQKLGLIIHNHLNSRIRLCWSTETGTFKYKDCIERSFVREKDWLRFCKALKISGVAACFVRGITYDEDHRIEPCIFSEKNYLGNSTVWKKYCQKYLKAQNTCLCPVRSSSVIS